MADTAAHLVDRVLRDSAVTRLFIDPPVDAETGDVHGKILRLSPLT